MCGRSCGPLDQLSWVSLGLCLRTILREGGLGLRACIRGLRLRACIRGLRLRACIRGSGGELGARQEHEAECDEISKL